MSPEELRRYSRPNADAESLVPVDLALEHIIEHSEVTDAGCWVTDFATVANSGPQMRLKKRDHFGRVLLRRWVYALVNFEGWRMPRIHVIGTTCGNDACINPDHVNWTLSRYLRKTR